MSLDALMQLNGVLLGGHFEHLNRTQWLQAVQDSFNQVPIALASSVHLQVAYEMVAPTPYRLQVSLGNGQAMLDQEVTACATGLRAFQLQLSLACQDRVPLLQCRAHWQLTALGWEDMT